MKNLRIDLDEKTTQATLTLFAKFNVIWMQKWTTILKNQEVIEQALQIWGRILRQLSNEQIDKAIQFCQKTYDYPPSHAQFIKAALNIPPFSWAYNNYRKPDHPFLKLVRQKLDGYLMNQCSEPDARRFYHDAYEATVYDVLQPFDVGFLEK